MATKALWFKGSEASVRKEGKALAATIYPGYLCEHHTTAGVVKVHATAGGNNNKMFALINDLKGGDLTDNYPINERVQLAVLARGSEINSMLSENQAIAVGDLLESAGDGTLQEWSSDPSLGAVNYLAIVGQALEAVTTATGVTARCKIEIW
jgi:hypothetical protein